MTLAEQIVAPYVKGNLENYSQDDRDYGLLYISTAIKIAEDALSMSNQITNKFCEMVAHTIQTIENRYKAGCEHADWYNNNMPGVGQTLAFLPTPKYPQELEVLKQLQYELLKLL